jgi:short-subunit dehydrogenase
MPIVMIQRSPQRILITGASAGIGAALAEAYAAPGITLGLLARRSDRLESLAQKLGSTGCRTILLTADVSDTEQTRAATERFRKEAGGVDLAIANAGLSKSDRLLEGDPAAGVEIIRINVMGVLNTLIPLVPAMVEQGSGHLVTIGSVAGFRGLPGKGAYCASKAAVKTLMDAYRPVLQRRGICVTTICPGFVETELTAKNRYAMPFLMPAARAAHLIQRAIARGKATYVFPWQMRLIVPLLVRIPDRLLPPYDRSA